MSDRTYWKIAVVITIALFSVGLFIFVLISFTSLSTSESITLAGTAISTTLSAILAYFYLTMRDIQERQTNITDTQSEIARAAQQPRLLLQEWYVVDNTIHAVLSNIGEGIATNITTTVCIRPINAENYYDLVSHCPIEEHRLAIDKESVGRKYIESNILEPGEKNAEFQSVIRPVNCFITDEEPENLISPDYLFRQLDLKDPRHVIISVVISHDDILQSTHHNTVWEAVVGYSEETSIDALLSKDVYELERSDINLVEPTNAPNQYASSSDQLLYN